MAIIAPFWATTDTYYAFRDGHSKVYYQVYSQTKKSSSEILNMASQHVKLYGDGTKFANFNASWVLVVTWYKLCPYVSFYSSNCRWVRRLLFILLLLLLLPLLLLLLLLLMLLLLALLLLLLRLLLLLLLILLV